MADVELLTDAEESEAFEALALTLLAQVPDDDDANSGMESGECGMRASQTVLSVWHFICGPTADTEAYCPSAVLDGPAAALGVCCSRWRLGSRAKRG